MEETFVPRPSYPKGIRIQGGRRRGMAHSRDRILVQHTEEGIRRWFYIEDVALPDPIRMGLPEFSSALLRKCHSWRPRSLKEEDNAEVQQLMGKIRTLAQSGFSIIEVMATSIVRGVQPLQFRGLPMWHYNGEDDASRCGRKGPDSLTALAAILADLYKGEKEEFTRLKRREGFSLYNPPNWVSFNPATLLNPLPSHV